MSRDKEWLTKIFGSLGIKGRRDFDDVIINRQIFHHIQHISTMMRLPSSSLLERASKRPLYGSHTRSFSSWYPFDSDTSFSLDDAKRVWKSSESNDDDEETTTFPSDSQPTHWTKSIFDKVGRNSDHINETLHKINQEELQGGRMAAKQLGVLREDPSEDMRLLMENYTVPSLASALRDREELLQTCAELMKHKQYAKVSQLLQPFQHEFVLRRRTNEYKLHLEQPLTTSSLEILRKALARMPRRVVHAHQQRAGVVLALCNVNGVPSVLLEKRATTLRAHPSEVCLPGGMVCSVSDRTIVSTCLREMQEEIGGLGSSKDFTVLGVLRCNWGEVHHLVGLAVTPLVCFVGDLTDASLEPNPDEVSEVFTIPLTLLLERKNWIHREGFAPIFVGGPHVIWGLSGYILERFAKDILSQYHGG